MAAKGFSWDADIVWEYGRSRWENGQLHCRTRQLTAANATNLLEKFGEAWLVKYLDDAREELDSWAESSDPV